MRKTTLCIALLTFAVACFVVAQNQPKKEPQTWRERAAERFQDTPSEADKATIEQNLPVLTKPPKKARRILVFYRCEGFIHTSIPFGNFAMEAIAEATKGFTVDLADEYEVFTKENLAKYDAILFNNTTNLVPTAEQQEAILDFIHSGKGIIGLHAASDNFKQWEEGLAMMGGVFDGHPWGSGGTWAFQVEDPDHPLNAAFQKEGFWFKDEIYWYKEESFEGRDKLRVLLSLDFSKRENLAPLEGDRWKEKVSAREPLDVPVSWCREIGKGRLFYTNLGHNNMTFADTMVLQHILDGIQYALGDLDADAIPSTEVSVKTVPAPETAL